MIICRRERACLHSDTPVRSALCERSVRLNTQSEKRCQVANIVAAAVPGAP